MTEKAAHRSGFWFLASAFRYDPRTAWLFLLPVMAVLAVVTDPGEQPRQDDQREDTR